MNRIRNIFLWCVLIGCVFYYNSLYAQDNNKEIKHGAYSGYNILMISFDGLQAAHLNHLGYFRKITPAIDRIAQEGFSFKNAISQASWTVPAHMTWFTSLYPSQHRCINKYSIYTEKEKILTNLKKLSPDVITLAEVLKKNGYVTAGFTGDAGVSGHFGFNQGFDVYIDGPTFGGIDKSIPNALEWLRKNHQKKFFMFLHGYDCHGQFDPPHGYTKKFVDTSYKGPFKGGREEQGELREEGLDKGYINLTEEDIKFWRALYDEKISDADERFRQFMEEFEKLRLLEKTIIILASDHGTEFYEHKRFDHGFSLYDELIRTLLVFRLPNAKAGKIVEDQVRAIDIMPTLLDLLEIKINKRIGEQMKGRSLAPLINGQHMHLDAFSETDYRLVTHKRSLRTWDGWKFIYTMETKEKELYNLKADPAESDNLIEKEERQAYELEQRLFVWLESMGQDENYYKRIWANMLKIKEY